MADMVERVARALCDDTLKRWRSPIALKSEPWREFIPAARAALEAMREPTPAILNVMEGDVPDGLEWEPASEDAPDYWRALIDAILQEQA